MWQKTGMVDVTYADDVPDGKEICSMTADSDLDKLDIEDYLKSAVERARIRTAPHALSKIGLSRPRACW